MGFKTKGYRGVAMAAALWALAAGGAAAQGCAGATPLVICDIAYSTKRLETCVAGGDVLYRFGPAGAPELALRRAVTEVDMTPWSGVGRDIWEAFSIQNAEITYEIWLAHARDPNAADPVMAGVRVMRGEAILAELACRPETIAEAGYPLALFEAKQAAGQRYSHATFTWE